MGYSNIAVARAWANQTREHSKSNNGNMSHEGRTLYSYATPIAQLVDVPNGAGVVALVTTETYSMTTTTKHMNATAKALDYGRSMPVFHVPFLLLDKPWRTGRSRANALATGYKPEDQHKANVDAYTSRINEERARLARARVYTSEDDLMRLINERYAYCRTFGLPVPADTPEEV